jgi:Flp pilus assembly protein TadD
MMRPRSFLLPLALGLLPGPALAQVQAPGTAAEGPFPFLNQSQTQRRALADPADTLSRSLRILAEAPRDLSALSDAGEAALAVGDIDAALGFWSRAEEVAPRDGRVKAGLASAFLQSQQPRIALRLFDDAVDLGVPEATIASDRGLARDLRGDNRRAQRDYAIALQAGVDDEATRRLALSLAISGDRALAIGALDPLLRKQDAAAWRARTFVAALTGDIADATATARALLPQRQAEQMVPFLARLATLRPAQKAAAVHFGSLPPVGKLGEETVSVAQGTILHAAPPAAAPPASVPTVPAAQPGWRAPAALPAAGLPAQTLKPTVPPAIITASRTPAKAPPIVIAAAPAPSAPVVASPVAVETPRLAGPLPSGAALSTEAKRPPPAEPRAAAAPKEEPAAKPDKPAAEPTRAEKAQPKPKRKPAPEKPRIWVQVAGGANRGTLDKEWAKLTKAAPDLYRRRKPHVIDAGATNRLVVGPFASEGEAQAYVNQLSRGGRSGFRVKSEAGKKVDPLD